MPDRAVDDRDAAVAFHAALDRLGDPVAVVRHRRARETDALIPNVCRHLVVLDAFAGQTAPAIDPELDQLTPREKEVLRYIARGYAYKEIARELHISVKTVESHVGGVLRKLQLTNRYELSRWASDRKLA